MYDQLLIIIIIAITITITIITIIIHGILLDPCPPINGRSHLLTINRSTMIKKLQQRCSWNIAPSGKWRIPWDSPTLLIVLHCAASFLSLSLSSLLSPNIAVIIFIIIDHCAASLFLSFALSLTTALHYVDESGWKLVKVDGNGRVVMFFFHSDCQKTHSHLIIDLHGAGTHFSALVCPFFLF